LPACARRGSSNTGNKPDRFPFSSACPATLAGLLRFATPWPPSGLKSHGN
jgi:hypothetical protein